MDKTAFRWLFNINYKDIGTLYFILGSLSGLLGTLLSVLIRLELNTSGNYVFQGNHQLYTIVVTAHALLMLFFIIMPILIDGFRNWFVPIFFGVERVWFNLNFPNSLKKNKAFIVISPLFKIVILWTTKFLISFTVAATIVFFWNSFFWGGGDVPPDIRSFLFRSGLLWAKLMIVFNQVLILTHINEAFSIVLNAVNLTILRETGPNFMLWALQFDFILYLDLCNQKEIQMVLPAFWIPAALVLETYRSTFFVGVGSLIAGAMPALTPFGSMLCCRLGEWATSFYSSGQILGVWVGFFYDELSLIDNAWCFKQSGIDVCFFDTLGCTVQQIKFQDKLQSTEAILLWEKYVSLFSYKMPVQTVCHAPVCTTLVPINVSNLVLATMLLTTGFLVGPQILL